MKDYDVGRQIGALTEAVKSLDKRVDEKASGLERKLDEYITKDTKDLADVKKIVNKHDIIFGKIGVVVVALLFFVGKGIDIVVEFVKNKVIGHG